MYQPPPQPPSQPLPPPSFSPQPPQPGPWQAQPPGYPPPYVPPQPQPPRKRSKRRRVFLIIGAVIVVLLLIIVIAAIATPTPPSPQAQITPTATHAAQAQTTKPAATAKPTTKPTAKPASGLPATHSTPRLGGPLSDFVGAYGQPNNHSNPPIDYHFLRAPDGVQDDLIVDLSPDNNQVDDITVATPDPGWTATEAQDHCMAYAPTDAHFKQRIPYADGSGYDLVYTSASLAHLFPAGDFTDGNGGTVPAGTFDVSYLYASDGQHIGSCDLIIGEQQTQ